MFRFSIVVGVLLFLACAPARKGPAPQAAQVLQKGPQTTLQYWRQLWRGESTTLKRLPGNLRRYVLSNPGRRMQVIYDSKTDRVVEVKQDASS